MFWSSMGLAKNQPLDFAYPGSKSCDKLGKYPFEGQITNSKYQIVRHTNFGGIILRLLSRCASGAYYWWCTGPKKMHSKQPVSLWPSTVDKSP